MVDGGFDLSDDPVFEVGIGLDLVQRQKERVYDGVAGDGDTGRVDVFAQEVVAARLGRGEVVRRDLRGELTIGLLGPRAVDVARAQSRLDVRDPDLPVKGGERRGEGRRRVAVDENDVGLEVVQHIAHPQQHVGSHVVEILSRFHDVQVVIGGDIEEPKHLVEHLAVLRGDADADVECWMLSV